MKKAKTKEHGGLCPQFAQIIGGKVESSDQDSCSVTKERDLDVSILGKPVPKSILEISIFYSSLDSQGRALNLGEIALLQDEVYPFSHIIENSGIVVSAIHNHWLFDQPQLIYIHIQSIEEPLSFATKVAAALRVLQ